MRRPANQLAGRRCRYRRGHTSSPHSSDPSTPALDPAPAAAPPAFALDRVTVQFGETRALDSVDLRVAPGERVAFVGPSGSGKTTLLRSFNGAVAASGGKVVALGVDPATVGVADLREFRSKVALIPQDLCLVPNVRVIQNVVMGRFSSQGFGAALRAFLLPSRATAADAFAILERVGIAEKIYQRTDTLSGGQQQRVAIARALFGSPEAILADEPVSSVDPARARETVRLLCEVAADRDLTLCVSLHDIGLAREFFPRLVGLREGRVLFDSAAGDVTDAQLDSLYQLA